MRRRDIIALLGFLAGGGAVALWSNFASFWRPRFNEHAAQTVTAVTDLMFPGDGLPGATELGIHNRIVAMSDLHALMTDGVDWLDRCAAQQGAPNFLALDESAKSAAVEAAYASDDVATSQFIIKLRFYAGRAYYSEPVIKSAFPYTGPPQPDGFPDFQDRPR
jgi:hypothetical protein